MVQLEEKLSSKLNEGCGYCGSKAGCYKSVPANEKKKREKFGFGKIKEK